jgi:hypothetical protein
MLARRYGRYCFAIALALVVVKVWIGRHVPATAMMSDDYENLNRSIYVVQGDLSLAGYPFDRIAYGPLYPLVVSPWLLFDHPATRLAVVFAINAVLSGTAVFFGALTVFRLTGVASWIVPICLAAWAPLFQFSFYAVTENLLFPLLAVLGWLAVDVEATCRSRRRFALLIAVTVVLPLVRVPGLAAAPAVMILLWRHRRALPGMPSAAASMVLAVLLPAAAYFLLYRVVVGSAREETYLAALAAVGRNPSGWLLPFALAQSQLRYLFLATGYWVLPILVVVALQARRLPEAERRPWVDHLLWTGITAAGFVAFAVVHLTQTQSGSGDGSFIYGRYDDPAGLLLAIAGLAALFAIRPPTVVQRVLVRGVAPVALCLVLGNGILTKRWIPVNECGLSILAMSEVSVGAVLLLTVLATSVSQLVDEKRLLVPAALGFFLVFGVLSDWRGMTYTIGRAGMVAHTLAGRDWIAEHVPPDARVGYDGTIIDNPAPGMKIRHLSDVYRAMMFETHPRPTVIVRTEEELGQVDYLYSAFFSQRFGAGGSSRLTQVWANDVYRLYRVSPAVAMP